MVWSTNGMVDDDWSVSLALVMPETSLSKQSMEKSAALKLRMEGYYQSLVQQAKEREAR